jgi:hypothetical protein
MEVNLPSFVFRLGDDGIPEVFIEGFYITMILELSFINGPGDHIEGIQ